MACGIWQRFSVVGREGRRRKATKIIEVKIKSTEA